MKLSFNRRSIFIIILLVCGVLTAGYMLMCTNTKAVPVSYAQFYALVKSGDISKVKIKSDTLLFEKKTDSKTTYKTENPDSPLLKEYLLLNGVELTHSISADDIISDIFDYSFYIIFFGALFFVFRKFVSPNTFRIIHSTKVHFTDVIGMDTLKRDMKQVVDIMQHPDAYEKRGIRMPKGILLEGAPGNGKTLFARALAGEAQVNFIPAKATDFESMFMAIGPAKVKLLFHKARRNAPCIVFIDEFDGIGTRRNYSGSAIETENTRIVTALLNELDGFVKNKGILVLAATNSIQALDEALIRPGRFDSHFSVPYPDTKERQNLVLMYTKDKHPDSNCTPEVLGKMFSGFSCSKIESVLNKAALLAAQADRTEFTLEDVRSALKDTQS